MGKGNGGTRTTSPYTRARTGQQIAINTNGRNVTAQMPSISETAMSIKDMKNRDMQKELQQAISRYESVLGLRERTIKLANTPGAYGVTYIGPDGSHGIYLNKSYFDVPKAEFAKTYAQSNYARRTGFKNTTRKPAQHTITHELAHATWTSGYTSDKAQKAGKEIKALYREFMKDTSTVRKKNYGSYGSKDVDEFWAEVITKGIHGDNDRYTRKALSIARKHRL